MRARASTAARARACVALVATLLGAPAAASAQAPAPPAPPPGGAAPGVPGAAPVTRTVEGGVYLPAPGDSAALRPVRGQWITLHRVGGGSAGPLDSTRTGAEGGYRLRYQRVPGDESVFFVSTSYAGITYFSAPLADADVSGAEAELVVYDTTAVTRSLSVDGRHVIIGAVDSTGRRPVVEVYELVNDTSLTVVADREEPAWRTMVPEGAQDFRAIGGEVSPDAVVREGQEVRLFAPIAPGSKRVSFAYTLAPADFPIRQPVGRDSLALLEVLIEDAAGMVDGAKLAETDSVVIDGRRFRRFVAQQVPPSAVMQIDLPAPPTDSRRLYVTVVLALIGLLMLLALWRSMRRPAATALGWNGGESATPEELARRIAALDAAFQRRRSPSVEDRQEYERQRGGLKAQLTDALVRHSE